ncbi:cupin domain-containing protein [Streptomyces sp. NPDC046385]|uniref:JmjC domain-containing protein n=1 Tax=Streptomyces sp. NPDC046385 TaxID=3154918 RepID=UPI00340DC95C
MSRVCSSAVGRRSTRRSPRRPDIQTETGHSNYVHAFLTPPGHQGLRHHWDQQMAVIVQISGTKRWQLWRPPVEGPMREYNESWRVWQEDYIPKWEAAGPDVEVDLKAGQSLLLPRGGFTTHTSWTPTSTAFT